MAPRVRQNVDPGPMPTGRRLAGRSSTSAALRLQSRAGNRAVTALLRQPAPGPAPPQITADPIGDLIREHLNTWYDNSRVGILTAQTQESDQSAAWFWIAFLGNMMWAATSLLGQEFVWTIRLMSFVGGALGANLMQQLHDEKSVPEIKDKVVEELSHRAAELERNVGLRKRIAEAFRKNGLATATDDEQLQRRSELAWKVMFGDDVPYADRSGVEQRARTTVEKVAAEFSKIYRDMSWLASQTGGSAFYLERDRPTTADQYKREHYADLGVFAGDERYRKSWPNYVIGMYHLALIRSGVVHEMLPQVTTRDMPTGQKEYRFSDGTTIVVDANSDQGLFGLDRGAHKVQLDPLAGTVIYVPTENRGAVRLGGD